MLCLFRVLLAACPAQEQLQLSDPAVLRKLSLEQLMQIRVSPFEVSTKEDKGYVASNSVSGSRLDTPIKDLPFALQAFTQSFIDDQAPVHNLFDIARYSPGVTYRSNDFTEGNANLSIRGFAVSNTAGNVQVLRDGFHGPSIFDFTNIARVEVVKGPASFLYGQLAPGGVVNVITKDPQPVYQGMGRVTYGSYDSYRLETDVTGPITKGLYFRLADTYDQDIRYWDPYDAHSIDVAPALLWQPTDSLSLSLKFEHFEKREDPGVTQKPGYPAPAGIVPSKSDSNLSGVDVPGLPRNWNTMAFGDFRDSDTSQLEALLNYKANEHWDLRLGYSHLEYKVDELFSGNLGMANTHTWLQGRRLRRQAYTNYDDTFESEAVGKYQVGSMSLRLLLGGQFVERKFHNEAGQAPNDPALGSVPVASPLPLWDLSDPSTWNRVVRLPLNNLTAARVDQTTHYIDKAGYAGTTFGFFEDRLLMLAGWRLTQTESELTDNLTERLAPKTTAQKVTPQYGALYKLTPGLSLFASYAESFVPGTQTVQVPGAPARPAAPTLGSGYDIGMKADLLDNRLSGTITFFDDRYENIVNDLSLLDPDTGRQIISSVQSGEQRSRGVEFDTTLSLTKNWQLYASYSFMDAKIVEFSGNDKTILHRGPSAPGYKEVRKFHNAPLQMSAPDLANIWTRYNFSTGPLRGLYVAGGVNFVYDQTLLPDTPRDYHQTYWLLNALVGYSWQCKGYPMSVQVTGKNLLDAYYRPSQSSRARPQEFAVAFTARF
jgi:iron complex outermembrane receptor protein